MVKILAYADPRRVVVAGDSMAIFVGVGGTSCSQHLSALHPEIPWVEEAVGGTTAAQMRDTRQLLTRWADTAEEPIGLIVTGTNSYIAGVSGENVYAQIETTADAMLLAGFTEIYATTCVTAAGIADDTKRTTGNALLMDTDALIGNGGFLTAPIDWAAEASLVTPSFGDLVHFGAAQRLYAAQVCDAVMFP
jgi:hypothetical protein